MAMKKYQEINDKGGRKDVRSHLDHPDTPCFMIVWFRHNIPLLRNCGNSYENCSRIQETFYFISSLRHCAKLVGGLL